MRRQRLTNSCAARDWAWRGLKASRARKGKLKLGIQQLTAKHEGMNPTGSHKDRMSAQGISRALEVGARTVVLGASAHAAYPEKPIRLIVPWAAGGLCRWKASRRFSGKLGRLRAFL